MKKLNLILLVTAVITAISFTACKKDDPKPEPVNQPPYIKSIEISTESTTHGSSVQVLSTVTDPEGDELSYTWSPEIGDVSDVNNQSTTWNIPTTATTGNDYKITLTVTDGIEITEKSKSIKIWKGGTVTGYIFFKDTEIPVSEVTVSVDGVSAISDNEGYYELLNAPYGINIITASKNGFDDSNKDIDISSTNEIDFYMTSSEYTKKLSGYVKTIDDIYLENAKVRLLNPNGNGSDIQTTSDINGYYQLVAVPNGERTIMVTRTNANSEEYDIYIGSDDVEFSPRLKIKRSIPLDILNPAFLEITGESSLNADHLYVKNGTITCLTDYLVPDSDIEGDYLGKIYFKFSGYRHITSSGSAKLYLYTNGIGTSTYWIFSATTSSNNYEVRGNLASIIRGKTIGLKWWTSNDSYLRIKSATLVYYW